jgi:subtilisin
MRRRTALLAGAFVVLMSLLAVRAYGGEGAGASRYIVVLKQAVDPAAVARMHAQKYGAGVEDVWGHALHGYSAVIPNDRVAQVRSDATVSYVEADGEATIAAQTLPWGSTRAGNGSGAVTNARVYVIDTGVDRSHPDLNVVSFVNFAKGQNTDCNGHGTHVAGTHVAGTIAAKDDSQGVVGVAPGAPIYAVKVLKCSGSGSWSKKTVARSRASTSAGSNYL